MSEQMIASDDMNVGDVFKDFYVVPDYQREYVWQAEEVEQLLGDIAGELAGLNPAKAPEYFIGSIVVCAGQNGTLDLIDGQQRMTTLFVTLCAIRDTLGELGQPRSNALESQIRFSSTDLSGNEQSRYRLELQYEDSGNVLVELANGSLPAESRRDTRSITNIRTAYGTARKFLTAHSGGDPDRLKEFYGYLTNKVKLIRIQTQDVAKALKIFETINDRGIGLDAMDLLKNLLFMKSDHADFDRLKKIWKEMQDVIHDMGEKPLRFLRYFLLSRYNVDDVLREDAIYSWLSKHEAEVGYSTAPVRFATDLLEAARAYRNFLYGKDKNGQPNRFLQNLKLLGGKAARQHLILLLAGRELPPGIFDGLARQVEELFFAYVITREQTRDFERDFAQWAADVRVMQDDASLEQLITKSFAPAKAKLAVRFDEAFARLTDETVQGYRLRYILAKLEQHVQLAAYGETPATIWLDKFLGAGVEIEHIYPQSASGKAFSEFGSYDDPLIVQRLGNLTLAEKPINASLGNRPYSEKRLVYPKSQFLLTRVLGEVQKIGIATKIDRAVAKLETFSEWNEPAVARRQKSLADLARLTWNMPVAPVMQRAGTQPALK